MIPVRAHESLIARRRALERQWGRFMGEEGNAGTLQRIDKVIASSWRRSANHIDPRKTNAAPTDENKIVSQLWRESPLRLAAAQELEVLEQLAREGSLAAAIADPKGRLLWTYASQHMRKRAEAVNFVAGGHWDEQSAGTNAVGLSLATRGPVTVFSSEHFLSAVHDWVCYAAPIIHPTSGELVGVLDISTTWTQHTPLGQAAVSDLARSIASRLPEQEQRSGLEIYALGCSKVVFNGKELRVSQRQLEILCLLALNPQGLTLEAFHAALYGDARVSTSTLKAELSHLRRMLNGQVGSRPYRLTVNVWGDFIELWKCLRANDTDKAIGMYRGPLLPQSASPEIEEWRNCVEAVMGRLMNSYDDFSMLMGKMCSGSMGSELVRERLAELLPERLI